MEDKKIHLAILNITSWAGQCGDATHVYGKLILSTKDDVTIKNVDDWNVRYLGDGIEITRPLTLELAKELDKKSGGKSYQRAFRICQEDPEFAKENEGYGNTNKFDTFDEVVKVGVKKWKELKLDCPFISLYEGQKYKKNSYEPSATVIKYPKKK